MKFLRVLLVILGGSATQISVAGGSDNSVVMKLMSIKVGSTSELVVRELGKADSISVENFTSISYEVWEYVSKDAHQIGSLTVDPKSKNVLSRTIDGDFISPRELSKFIKQKHAANKFVKYIPCHGHGDEEVQVDVNAGLFIAARDGKISLFSEANPSISKLRVEQFYLKCPKLQPAKKSDL